MAHYNIIRIIIIIYTTFLLGGYSNFQMTKLIGRHGEVLNVSSQKTF